MNHKLFVIGQTIFISLFLAGVFVFYPRAHIDVSGNTVNIKSINAHVIIISIKKRILC